MGCDIHVFIQYRRKGQNRFNEYAEVDLDRNYAMFGFMADVRTPKGLEPLFECRGCPPDEPRSKWDDIDHSLSWLTCDEYHDALDAYRELGETPRFSYCVLGDILRSLISNGAAGSRIIFWFDS